MRPCRNSWTWYGVWLLVLTTYSSCSIAQGAERAGPPNVILVMTDDQGYGDLSCHGNPILKTPNLDGLHAQSVRLTNFHVDPTCSPTRSALLTGRYSSRTGVWHTIMGRSILRKDETTLANVFAHHGYRTGLFGKWHLGDNYPYRAQDRGFQESLTHGGGGVGQTPDFWGNNYFDNTLLRNGQREKVPGYCTDVFFDAALKFIETNRDRPFFCYLPTNAPHAPYNVDEKYSKPYRERGVPEGRARFYGMIANFDDNMGRLLARLKDLKLEENTILIYMTDNGTANGYTEKTREGFNAGMRDVKGSEYDGGHRVPCFIRWPGQLKPKDVSYLSAPIDLLPTLAALCKLKHPGKEPLDGADLSPLLRQDKADLPARTLFVHSQRLEHPEKWRKSAVMTQRWRLINGKELYDIQSDPGQRQDVAAKHAEVVTDLRRQYDDWWVSLSKRFGEYCEIALGAEQENPTRLCCHDWHGEIAPSDQIALTRAVKANGWWAIEVVRGGQYEITLRQLPAEAKQPIQGTTARIKVGDLERNQAIPKDAQSITFPVELKPGKTKLQTWFADETGDLRGAYYVEVKFVQ
ncbi:MAG: arylsulfatase [Planctomycetia bacterium]|nr:arylsulfatase [Planctomycetia bacterium]